MIDLKETITNTDTGPKLIAELTANWEDFMCFKYPTSCAHCCVGWRTRCTVDSDTKRNSYKSRPDECPLGLVLLSIMD